MWRNFLPFLAYHLWRWWISLVRKLFELWNYNNFWEIYVYNIIYRSKRSTPSFDIKIDIHYICSIARKNLMLDYMAIKEHYASKQRKFLPNRFTWEMVRKIIKRSHFFYPDEHICCVLLFHSISSHILTFMYKDTVLTSLHLNRFRSHAFIASFLLFPKLLFYYKNNYQ